MKNQIILTSLLLFCCFFPDVLADSPLTSTPFSSAYQEDSIIVEAAKSNGLLTQGLMDYLIGRDNPIDIKMALINELGWDFDGKQNASLFFEFLKLKKGYAGEEDFSENGEGDEFLCMAYLKALDNYFKVDSALVFADLSLQKKPESYTYQIVAAIIKAQKAMETDWCSIYRLTNNVRMDKSLEMDMREEASTIIFEYMDLYKSECN